MASAAEPVRRSYGARLLTLVSQIATCLFVLWVIVLYGVALHAIHYPLLLTFAAFTIGGYLCIWVHELGHAVAAWAVGWRVIVFAVRPFAFHLPNRELVPMPRSENQELGGYVLPVPGSAAAASVWSSAIITAGGPLANLLLGAWAIGSALAAHGNVSFGSAFGLQSVLLAAASLLPRAVGQHQTDGRSLWLLFQARADFPRLMPVAWLEVLGKYRVRLRDKPQWLIDLAEERLGASDGAARWFETIRIGRMLDAAEVNIPIARSALDDFRARHGSDEWQSYCDAYLAAVWEGDGAAAAERLWHGERDADLEPLRLAAEAAIAARLGQDRATRIALANMDAVLGMRSPFTDRTFRDIRKQIERLL